MSIRCSPAARCSRGREVLDKAEIPGRSDIGALRLRLVATKDQPPADFPLTTAEGKPHPAVLLDLDYWAVLPR